MRMVRTIVAILFFVSLFGCASGSYIVTGKVRPAIKPSEVKLYLDPPSQYETIGIVESSSEVQLTSQAAQDRAIKELKAQAAKIGANGVLLLVTEDIPVGGGGGFYSSGIYYSSSSEKKSVRGKAIFVIKE